MSDLCLKSNYGILRKNHLALLILLGILSITLISTQIRFPYQEGSDPFIDYWKIPDESDIYLQTFRLIKDIRIIDVEEADYDQDGLPDNEEYKYRCSPFVPDSDGDGLLDGAEVYHYKTIPYKADSDNDYLIDSLEVYIFFTHPMRYDTDNDDLCDGFEVLLLKSNPFSSDTDYDSLDDGSEVRKYFTDIRKPDTDQDGLLDGDEVHLYNTNPLSDDTDGDNLKDEWEIMNNHNPNRKDDFLTVFGFYVLSPIIVTLLLFVAIFGSTQLRTIKVFGYRHKYEIINQVDQDKRILYELLSRIPEGQEINVQKLAQLTHETEEEILRLLSCLFDSKSLDDESELIAEDIIFKTSTDEHDFNLTCFYCNYPIDGKKDRCDYCEEEIVRCKECNDIVSYSDYYAVCSSCGIIGEPEDITAFITVEIICEKCLVQNRYFYV